MEIETEIECKYSTILGDWVDEGSSEEDIDSAVEGHIQDWCIEHKVDRKDVSIVVNNKTKRCPMCSKPMQELEEKTSKNTFWQCKDCVITVEILYSLRDPK